jgi:class 3 adenylate cyclase/alpha-beta hydrolase superfamily lysophospholipase
VEIPQTSYAQSGEVAIAYQAFGDGPLDLVYVPGFVSNVEVLWEFPRYAEWMRRLASLARVIVFDKRGTGLSDRVAGAPDLETRMDDLRAVMDAAGSRRAVVLGISEGGPMSLLFAATYPERVPALILYSTFARATWAPDNPRATTREEVERVAAAAQTHWGTREHAREMAAMWGVADADDDATLELIARRVRATASPGAASALYRMNAQVDVRHVLPAIHVPTLVLSRRDGNFELSQTIARSVSGARFVELPGTRHIPWVDDIELMVDEIATFLGALDVVEDEPDRVLATVLFTDLVGSTAKAVELGDAGWRELLREHHARVRTQLARFRGREIDTAGDGFFASFDGPARAIRCARAVADSVAEVGLDVRAGLHTGECEQVDGKVAGIAVNIGSRIAALAGPGEVLVSQTVRDLVAGSQIEFDERGATELKGIPGEWRLYAVSGA